MVILQYLQSVSVQQVLKMDVDNLAFDLARICCSSDFSDVTLVSKDNTRIPGHKQILATRSPYFARMLFGGLRESREEEVHLPVTGRVLRLVLEHTYTGTVGLEGEEVEVLAELLDMARMMCSSNLEGKVEARMMEILDHAAGIQTLTRDAVKILNEAVRQKFANIEEKFFECFDLVNIWDCSIRSGEFLDFSFSALKSLLNLFNEEEGNIQRQNKISEIVTLWLQASELDDEDKNVILSLVGLDHMKMGQLVDVLEKFDTEVNSKIIDMVKVKEEQTLSMVESLRSDNETLKTQMEQDKEDFSVQMANFIYVKDQELFRMQDELNNAKKVIQRKDAEIEAFGEKVSESNGNPRTKQTSKQNGPPSRRRLFNLVKHIDSNVRKYLEIAQTSFDDNDGLEMISREEALKCSRIMNSAYEALTSFKSMRNDLVNENDKRTWEEVFERTNAELFIMDMYNSTKLFANFYPANQTQFFENTLRISDQIKEDVLETLGHILFHYK